LWILDVGDYVSRLPNAPGDEPIARDHPRNGGR
jgi:hypothetical protein